MFPEMHATIDFETYSEAGYVYGQTTRKWGPLLNASKKGLAGVGAANYAQHPSTDILSLAYKIDDVTKGDVTLWVPGDEVPLDFFRVDKFEAWNVSFERWIWEEIAVKRYGFPSVPSHSWRCAMAKSRAFALPGSLAEAGRVLNTSIQKDKDGTRLINKFSVPRNPTAKNPALRIRPSDDPEDAQRLYNYNRRDVLAEVEISERIPRLSPFELAFWQCDQEINKRGVQIDVPAVLNGIHIIEQAHVTYNAELPALTNGAVTKSSEVARIKAWMLTLGVAVDSLGKEHTAELLKNPLLLPQIRRVLEIRQLIGSAAVKKLYAMLNQCTREGRLHDLFVYHSARTGRAAGAGVQPQNLPKGADGFDVDACLNVISTGSLKAVEVAYGNATKAVSNCLRGLFIARSGHELIGSDYSAIEAVVLAELAGESWRQEVFRTHGKIYEMSASLITGVPFEQIGEHKEKTGTHHELRRLGKVAELASGFGGWVGAWKAFGADAFLDDDAITEAVSTWRTKSPAIVEYWGGQDRSSKDEKGRWKKCAEYYGVEGAAIQAVLYPGRSFEARYVKFIVENDILFCTLPSDRRLTYHKPRLEPSVRRQGTVELSYEGWNTNPKKGPIGWIRMLTYGPSLVENIVQAVSRDILAKAVVSLEAEGYPVVLHVHDEIVSEVPRGEKTLEAFETILSTLPDWANDWPIRAKSGWVGHRYGK